MSTIFATNLISSPEGGQVSTDTADVADLIGFSCAVAVCIVGVVDVAGGVVVVGGGVGVGVTRAGVVSSCLMTALSCSATVKVGSSRGNLVVFSRHFLGYACMGKYVWGCVGVCV